MMQTSAPARSDRQAGFTLVELLVVLIILGLVSAAVIVAMPDDGQSLAKEAERLAARARAAQDAAVITARPMALRVSSAGYGFDRRERGGWRALQDRPFAQQPWDQGTRASLQPDKTRLIFDPAGLSDPATVTLARGEQRVGVVLAGDGTIHVQR